MNDMYQKTPFLASHGYVDDKLRIQLLNSSPNGNDIDFEDLASDSCFRDKLFFIAPKLKHNFYEELMKHNKGRSKLLRGAQDKETIEE